MKKILAALILYAAIVPTAFGVEPFIIKDIRVIGLQRISVGTVFNYLPLKVGDRLTEQSARDAIRALYRTDFFKDIKLDRQGNVLIVAVEERPSIASIKITGTKEISEKDLKKGLQEIGLAEGRVFDQSLLDKVTQELKRQYFNRGYYGVRTKVTVTPLERNRVAITIDVSEGRIARIREITIVGNHQFSEKTLLGQFMLKPNALFGFITKRDQYSKEKLIGDLERLRSYYQDRGFLEFNIDSTEVSITPNKQSIYITINITEGKRYTVTGYKIAGKMVIPEKDIRSLITIKPGETFSRRKVTDITKAITNRLANDGYAFANVNAIPDLDREKGTVSFTFYVDPGSRVYVRRIRFFGNTSTHDNVLRREMRQYEGAWFSEAEIQRSRIRLQRLGFFDDVNVETRPVPGSPDQVDLDVTVKERLTGQLMFSVGYSDTEGALFNISVSERNLFGTGNNLSLSYNNSQVTRLTSIQYTNPYWTRSGISRSFNIYKSSVDLSQINTSLASYTTNTEGAGVSFGIPTSETRTVTLGFGYDRTDLSLTPTSPQVAQNFVARYGNSNQVFKATVGWAYDSLNSYIFPTSGAVDRVSADIAVPGSDLRYYKTDFVSSYYWPIGRNSTFRVRGELGYGNGYDGTGELPFYDNFFAGGSTSVRGYRTSTLGPIDPVSLTSIGGNKLTLVNAEYLFPVPGTAPDNNSMRLSTFVDGGQVYGPGQAVDPGQLRFSTGLAFNWFTPVGPLSLSYAFPLNAKPGDQTNRFQFTLGVPFQ